MGVHIKNSVPNDGKLGNFCDVGNVVGKISGSRGVACYVCPSNDTRFKYNTTLFGPSGSKRVTNNTVS